MSKLPKHPVLNRHTWAADQRKRDIKKISLDLNFELEQMERRERIATVVLGYGALTLMAIVIIVRVYL